MMGLLADIIGNAAITGNRMLERDNKAQAEEEARIRQEERANLQRIAQEGREDVRQRSLADYKLEADKKAEEFKQSILEAKRLKMNSDIEAKQQGLIKQAQVDKLNSGVYADGYQTNVNDVSDEELATVPLDDKTKDALRLRASRDVGYTSDKDFAAIEGKEDLLQLKRELGQAKNDVEREKIISRFEIAAAKAGSGGGGTKLHSVFTADGKTMGAMSDGSVIELAGSSLNYEKKLSDIIDKRSKEDRNFRKLSLEEKRALAVQQLSGTSTKTVTPSTSDVGKSTVQTLPQGAVQVGTSGGKPVYKLPNGKMFKQD